MHKLILSIIAVAFLQIGFITYVTTDQTADTARLTVTRTQPVSPGSSAVDSLADDGIEVASLDEDPFFRRVTADIQSSRTSRAAKAHYPVRSKFKRTARKTRVQPEPFVPEQVIITYAVHKPYKFVEREPYRNISVYNEPVVMNKSEDVEQTIPKSQKSDGNPVLNVIKKPFGWIKTLGSKLK
ncbi:MAG: hypothetical protein ACKVQW_00930 [Pyrinomonadaceae bacterium]